MKNKILPEFYIVAINDTMYCDLSDVTAVKEVWSIYLADFSRNTYCCELTPSVYLDYLDLDLVMYDNVDENSIDYAHHIFYDNYKGESIYMHRSALKNSDKIKIKPVLWAETDWMQEWDLEDEKQYNELLETAHEYIREDGCYW